MPIQQSTIALDIIDAKLAQAHAAIDMAGILTDDQIEHLGAKGIGNILWLAREAIEAAQAAADSERAAPAPDARAATATDATG